MVGKTSCYLSASNCVRKVDSNSFAWSAPWIQSYQALECFLKEI
jgi:hypothetical protein